MEFILFPFIKRVQVMNSDVTQIIFSHIKVTFGYSKVINSMINYVSIYKVSLLSHLYHFCLIWLYNCTNSSAFFFQNKNVAIPCYIAMQMNCVLL